MLGYLVRRLSVVVPTLVGITLFTFALIRLIPGDPVLVMAGERNLTPERYQQTLAQLGLDRPLWEQYLNYVWKLLQGDLGTSIALKRTVWSQFVTLFPATVELSMAAMTVAIVIGLPAGIYAAVRRGRPGDHLLMGLTVTGFSMPIFWWGLILIMVSSTWLGLTPVSGRISVMFYPEPVTGFMVIDAWLSGEKGALASALHHLVLPAIVLGTIPMAVIARITRSSMLEVLGDDYIRTARAKGLSPLRVIAVHALRNALIPVVTVIGLQVSTLFAGAILTESIFSWPGIGKWMVESIGRRDYPVVQSGLVLIACVIVAVNLLVDVLYGAINPRIRHQR